MMHSLLSRLLVVSLAMTATAPVAAQAKPPERLFISGHSLVDQPLPNHLAEIARSLGAPLQWNRQYRVGSSIKTRTVGDDPANPWGGYREGDNREGSGLNVLQELKQPQTVSGGAYDGLLITEQHGLMGTLVWNDTVRHLRHFHERHIAANPQGRTWFYEPWLSLSSKDDPHVWIAYERAASLRWQCIAHRINHSLEADGRADRIEALPAAVALAGLVERAIASPSALPGVSRATVRETVNSLIADDVHATPLGAYYMALVSYAYLFERSPVGAWKPAEVGGDAAASLQQTAWQLVQQERTQRQRLSLTDCDNAMRSFVAPYWTYVRATYWAQDNWFKAQWQWLKHWAQWRWALRNGAASNPMRYESSNDKAWWLPAP
jgi:hypothetical protein